MTDRSRRHEPRIGRFRKAILRDAFDLVQFVISAGTYAWFWTSDAGKQIWVWFAIGLPLLFAYIFIGGFVRSKLGLNERDAD